MLITLQSSVHAVFDLYIKEKRSFFEFSFMFLLFSSIAAYFFSLIVVYLANQIYVIGELGTSYSLLELFSLPLVSITFKLDTNYFCIVSLSLYAIYLHHLHQNPEEKPTISNLLKTISTNDWKKYWIVITFLILYYTLTFVDPFDISTEEPLFDFENMDYETNSYNYFYEWINNLVRLVNRFIPYLAAGLLVVWKVHPQINKNIIRDFIRYGWIILVVAFCMESIYQGFSFYIQEYFIRFIGDSPKIVAAQQVVKMLLSLLILSYFYLGFAGILLFPVLIRKQELDKLSQPEEKFPAEISSTAIE